MRLQRRGVVYLLLLLVFVGLIYMLSKSYAGFGNGPAEKSYADMVRAANNGEVASSVATSSTEIKWSDKSGHQYKTVVNPDLVKLDTELQSKLNINYQSQSSSSIFLSILPNIIFLVLIGAFMWYMLRQTQSGNNQAMSFGVPLVTAGRTEDKADVNARVAWSGVGIDLATNEPTPQALREAVRTVLDKPDHRSRASRIADEFKGIDTRSEVLRIVSQVVHPSDGDDLRQGKIAAKKKTAVGRV